MKEYVKSPAGDDWDRHWEEYTQAAEENPAQNYRRELVFLFLTLPSAGNGVRLLDIGSGQGDFAATVKARYPAAQILGLELSQSGVEISRRKVPEAAFMRCNLLDETHVPEDWRRWATHAVCSEVIEHVDDPASLLRNARLYMSAGCQLVVTAPGGPMSAFDKHIGHRKHWTPSEIEALLHDAGYAAERTTAAGFPFFNLYRCLVILRGKKLIADVSTETTSSMSWSARTAMAVFSTLLRPSLNSTRLGWQMVAGARLPG